MRSLRSLSPSTRPSPRPQTKRPGLMAMIDRSIAGIKGPIRFGALSSLLLVSAFGCDDAAENPDDNANLGRPPIPLEDRGNVAPNSAIKILSPSKRVPDGEFMGGSIFNFPNFIDFIYGDVRPSPASFYTDPNSDLALPVGALDPANAMNSNMGERTLVPESGFVAIGATNVITEHVDSCPEAPRPIVRDVELGIITPTAEVGCPWATTWTYGGVTLYAPFEGLTTVCATAGAITNGAVALDLQDSGIALAEIPSLVRNLATEPRTPVLQGYGFGSTASSCLTILSNPDTRNLEIRYNLSFESARPTVSPHDSEQRRDDVVSVGRSENISVSAECPPDNLEQCRVTRYSGDIRTGRLDEDLAPIRFEASLNQEELSVLGDGFLSLAFVEAMNFHYGLLTDEVGALHPDLADTIETVLACETANFSGDPNAEIVCRSFFE